MLIILGWWNSLWLKTLQRLLVTVYVEVLPIENYSTDVDQAFLCMKIKICKIKYVILVRSINNLI